MISGSNIFTGTQDSGVFLSTNNGTSWSPVNNGINKKVNELTLSGTNIFASTRGGGIFLSTNNGSSWSTVNNGLTTLYIYPLAVSGSNLFAGTYGSSGVFLSTNNGTNWTSVGLLTLYIMSFAVNDTYVFAGTHLSGVYRTSNNGTNWTPISLNLPGHDVYALSASGTNLALACNSGVYISKNNGTNWLNIDQSLGEVYAFLFTNNYLFAGTRFSSVWRRPLSDFVGIQNISTETPSKYSLGQNYPNPFNAVTKIKLDVPSVKQASLLVTLKVYDVMGREVQTLVNERLQPGTYEVAFDGSMLNSGVYFYKMVVRHGGSSTDGFTETKKMLLIK
jgi:hypothetical protein